MCVHAGTRAHASMYLLFVFVFFVLFFFLLFLICVCQSSVCVVVCVCVLVEAFSRYDVGLSWYAQVEDLIEYKYIDGKEPLCASLQTFLQYVHKEV